MTFLPKASNIYILSTKSSRYKHSSRQHFPPGIQNGERGVEPELRLVDVDVCTFSLSCAGHFKMFCCFSLLYYSPFPLGSWLYVLYVLCLNCCNNNCHTGAQKNHNSELEYIFIKTFFSLIGFMFTQADIKPKSYSETMLITKESEYEYDCQFYSWSFHILPIVRPSFLGYSVQVSH